MAKEPRTFDRAIPTSRPTRSMLSRGATRSTTNRAALYPPATVTESVRLAASPSGPDEISGEDLRDHVIGVGVGDAERGYACGDVARHEPARAVERGDDMRWVSARGLGDDLDIGLGCLPAVASTSEPGPPDPRQTWPTMLSDDLHRPPAKRTFNASKE